MADDCVDYRSALADALRRRHGRTIPTRFQYEQHGPPHCPEFRATVDLGDAAGGLFRADTWSKTKKKSEQSACRVALNSLPNGAALNSLSNGGRVAAPATFNWKGQLQEYCMKHYPGQRIKYSVTKHGPDHAPTFHATVAIETRMFSSSPDHRFLRSADAEAGAARVAFDSLRSNPNTLTLASLIQVIPETVRPDSNASQHEAVIHTESATASAPPLLLSTPRLYQIAMYRAAMQRNILCCLPTGTGKTLIACLVIKRMHDLNPNKQILFLTDRLPLVDQQARVIARETGLCAISFRGGRKSYADDLRRAQVVVIIAALYENLIREGAVRVADVSLVVVDEAHHVTGQHPFSRLLVNHFWRQSRRDLHPKLFALTASPAAERDLFYTVVGLVDLRDRIRGVIVRPRGAVLDSMKGYVNASHRSHPEMILVKTSRAEALFSGSIVPLFAFKWGRKGPPAAVDNSEDIDLDNDAYYDPDRIPSKKIAVDDHDDDECCETSLSRDEIISIICDAILKDCVDFGAAVAFDHLAELNERYGGPLSPDQVRNARPLLDRVRPTPRTKFDELVKFLTNNAAPDSRAIVFVSTRRTAHVLRDLLEQSGMKAGVITGHGAGGDGGMSHAMQSDVIDAFRERRINLLVATTVVEEGFDVPGCNLVIRIDLPATVTALVQSRGRARRHNSRFVMIASEREQVRFNQLRKRESMIETAIDVLELSELSKIPRSIVYNDSFVCTLNVQLTKTFVPLLSAGSSADLVRFRTTADGLQYKSVLSVDCRIGSDPKRTGMMQVAAIGHGPTKKAAQDCAARHLVESHFILASFVHLSNNRLQNWK